MSCISSGPSAGASAATWGILGFVSSASSSYSMLLRRHTWIAKPLSWFWILVVSAPFFSIHWPEHLFSETLVSFSSHACASLWMFFWLFLLPFHQLHILLFYSFERKSNLIYFLLPSDFYIYQYLVLVSAPGETANPIQDSFNGLFLIS